MAERGVKNVDNVTVSFDISALSFVAESFGMKFIDGLLKRVDGDRVVKCMICEREMGERDVGGFFKAEPEIDVCCNNLICLVEADND